MYILSHLLIIILLLFTLIYAQWIETQIRFIMKITRNSFTQIAYFKHPILSYT